MLSLQSQLYTTILILSSTIKFFLSSVLFLPHSSQWCFFWFRSFSFVCSKLGCIGGGFLLALFSLSYNHDDDGHDMNTWLGVFFFFFFFLLALEVLQECYIICKEYWVCRLLFSIFFFPFVFLLRLYHLFPFRGC